MADEFNQPLSGNIMPRFAGPSTMMRLASASGPRGLDAAFVGVPFDLGTSNRAGTRFGPRQIRAESALLRPCNLGTGAAPFDRLRVADLGDVPLNPYNPGKSLAAIEEFFSALAREGCRPLALGGDHTITLPILRALHRQYGSLGLVHVDAHADCNDAMMGETVTHGTHIRRAVEEGLVTPSRVVQIGLRGTGYSPGDLDWGRDQGFTVVQAEQCWHISLAPLMNQVRQALGPGPVYLTYDIDGLDPSCAPGTGTPEPGGLTSAQGLEIIRGCQGLDLVGCDLVEVSPPYDPLGNTALLAANLLFEMLCVLPDRRPGS
ncbi:MAG: agmatinase [Deltaproteobacteria bacterium]|nr:agmatinase [Deltaproteobacteria bacterium]